MQRELATDRQTDRQLTPQLGQRPSFFQQTYHVSGWNYLVAKAALDFFPRETKQSLNPMHKV